MSGLKEKALSVALVAALLFCTFPVSTGVPILDRGRYEQAHAIAPAVPIIVATACAAFGVCVAGTSTTMYNANLDSVYNGLKNETSYWSSSWAQYCQDKGGFDAAMASAVAVDGQNINLKVLSDAGFFDSLRSYSVYCVEQGTAVSGSGSAAGNYGFLQFGNLKVDTFSGTAPYEAELRAQYYTLGDVVAYQNLSNGGVYLYVSGMSPASVDVSISGSNVDLYFNGRGFGTTNGGQSFGQWSFSHTGMVNYSSLRLNSADNFRYSGANVSESIGSDVAVVDPAVIDGTAVVPDGYVQPFEPTDAQLEAGYSSADVIAAEVGEIGQTTGVISEDVASILTGVGGILTALNPLAGILTAVNTISGVVSGVQSSPFSWLQTWWNTLTGWWTSLLSMLGDTPLSTLLGPLAGIADIVGALTGQGGVLEWLGNVTVGDLLTGVQSGVGSITGAISSGVTTMVNDVDTWLGTLNGWWEGLGDFLGLGVDGLTLEGLLEGVLSGTIPLTLSGVIEAIQAAVDALTASIDGVLEGVTFPTFPGLDLRPGSGTFDLAVPTNDVFRDFNGQLANKAPFAYLVAINDDFQAINGTYSANPTFYWEVTTPFVGLVRVDAGPWLNYEVHGTTIAQLLRIAFNSFMIVMLLRLCFKAMQSGLSK